MDGIFLLDKPKGPSSRAAIDRFAKKFPGKIRFGHAGTLDPLASGLLILATGKATRLIEIYQAMAKNYLASIRLGHTSETDDGEGPIHEVPGAVLPSTEVIEKHLGNYLGRLEQTPPAFSAAKIQGKRSYSLARAGRVAAPAPKEVQIHSFQLLSHQKSQLTVEWQVGGGTYIRSLARDLGSDLGCGAYLEDLRRTRIGPWTVEKAAGWDSPEPEGFIPMEHTLDHIERLELSLPRCRVVVAGKKIPLEPAEMRGLEPPASCEGQPDREDLRALTEPGGKMFGLVEIRWDENQNPWAIPWKFFFHVNEISN